MTLVAIFTPFVEVKADTRQHSDRAVDDAYDPREGYIFWWNFEEITASLAFLTLQYSFIFQLQQDILKELQGYLSFL